MGAHANAKSVYWQLKKNLTTLFWSISVTLKFSGRGTVQGHGFIPGICFRPAACRRLELEPRYTVRRNRSIGQSAR